MRKTLLTESGFRTLDAELKSLKSDKRPAIIKAIAEAREHGDLSENAEYHAAKEHQGLVERRIRELEVLVGSAEVIDVTRLSGPVKFGATVVLVDEDSGKETTYQVVGEPGSRYPERQDQHKFADWPRIDREIGRRRRGSHHAGWRAGTTQSGAFATFDGNPV